MLRIHLLTYFILVSVHFLMITQCHSKSSEKSGIAAFSGLKICSRNRQLNLNTTTFLYTNKQDIVLKRMFLVTCRTMGVRSPPSNANRFGSCLKVEFFGKVV